MSAVEPGQVWKRKKDGVLTTVIHVDSGISWRRSVLHQAQRRTHTEISNFLRKYELLKEAG